MERIIDLVELIRTRYDARIGKNYLGNADIATVYPVHRNEYVQATMRRGGPPSGDAQLVVRRSLGELEDIAAPHRIPADLRFFEEYYGGLSLPFAKHSFVIYGCGSGENMDYPSIIQDFDGGSRYRNGWLDVGGLMIHNPSSRYETDSVYFSSDLAGKLHVGAVATGGIYHGVDLWDEGQLPVLVVANSFTVWLDRIAHNDWAPFL